MPHGSWIAASSRAKNRRWPRYSWPRGSIGSSTERSRSAVHWEFPKIPRSLCSTGRSDRFASTTVQARCTERRSRGESFEGWGNRERRAANLQSAISGPVALRRRIYLLRHADVSYVDPAGQLIPPHQAALTPAGEDQARVLADAFRSVRFERAITSGLARTLHTARLILGGTSDAPAIESWSDFAEMRGGRLRDFAPDQLEAEFLGAFRGAAPESARFLGGESIGELFDRVLPALQRLIDDPGWDCALLVLHGGVNRAILSYAVTGERTFLGHLEQSPACVNVLDIGEEWVVRAVNLCLDDLLHVSGRETTMEKLLAQIRDHLPRDERP